MAKLKSLLLRPFGLIDAIVLICFITLPIVQMQFFADDPGVGWHLKTGELIAQSGEIPRVDPFLASTTPRVWISDQWLSDLILYAIFERGGFALIYAALTALYLLTYFGLLYHGVLSRSRSALGAALGTFLAFKLGIPHFILRPVLFSFTFFVAVYLIAERLYRQYSARTSLSSNDLKLTLNERSKNRNRIIYPALVLLFVLWANMHPSFVLGLLVLFVACAALLFDLLIFGEKEMRDAQLKRLARPFALCVLCAIATLINPYGIELHSSIYALGQSSYFMQMHLEWASPELSDRASQFMFLEAGLIVALIALNGIGSLGTFSLILLPLFFVFCLDAVRFFPYFAIVAAAPLAKLLTQIEQSRLCSFKACNLIKRSFSKLERRELNSYRGFVVVPLCLLILTSGLVFRKVPLYQGEYGPNSTKFPYAALEKLREISHPEAAERVAAPAAWGGFISMYSEGRFKAIIDDRNILLGEDFYREFQQRLGSSSDWLKYLQEQQVKFLLIPRESTFVETVRNSGQKLIFEDSVSVLFEVSYK